MTIDATDASEPIDSTVTVAGDEFDPDALRERYRAERDKRLRVDGNEQYVEMTGRFATYLDDPYTPVVEREPLTDAVEVLVIGAGFGGLLVGARLREAGIRSLRIVEKGGDVGGTWYWNRYPGAACDVESYIYLPLLEEVGTVPSQKYAAAAEILEHSRAIARRYDLYRDLVLSTAVTEVRWDDGEGSWTVSTDRGDEMRARYVIMANGPLHRPKLPGIPGIEHFAGHSFHTSRWDYEYTGGGPDGGLDRLGDKVVGIIGTGATAVQCVPHLGEGAKHLYVFQRTPSSIDVRANRPTDREWFAQLEPGWQKRRMDNFNNLVSGIPEPEDMVDDGWTDIIGNLLLRMRRGDAGAGDLADAVELADFEKMNQIRSRVDELVEDPAIAAALKPWYRQFCKRPCFHDEYLQTFNRPNVTLVDTEGKGVERITPGGVVVAGVEYAVDCLIYATGFEVGTEYARRAGYEVVGRGGLTMTEKWADGAVTLHGFHMHDFPNLFVVSLVQSGFSVNFPHMLDEQARHLGHLLGHAQREGIVRIEATQSAEQGWTETIVALAQMNLGFLEQCTPGYYNNEGRPAERSLRNSSYGAGSGAFAKVLEEWRDAGEFAGLELTR